MIKFFEYLTKSKFQCFFVILVFTVLLAILNYKSKSKEENFTTSIDCGDLDGDLDYYKNLKYCEKFKLLTCDTVMTKVNELFNVDLTNQTVCNNIIEVYLDNAYVLFQIYIKETENEDQEGNRSFPDISSSDENSCKKLKFILSGEFMYYVLKRLVKFNNDYRNGNIVFDMVEYLNKNLYTTITIPNVVEHNTSLHVKVKLGVHINDLQYKQIDSSNSKKFKVVGNKSFSVDHNGGTLTATIHKEYTIGDETYSLNPIEIKTEIVPSRPSKHFLTGYENDGNDLYYYPFYIRDTTKGIYVKQNWDGGNIRGRHLLGDIVATSIFYIQQFKHENPKTKKLETGFKIFSNDSSGDSLLCWDRGGRQSSPVVKQERCDGETDNQIMFLIPIIPIIPIEQNYWTHDNNTKFRIQDQRGEVLTQQLDNGEWKYKFIDSVYNGSGVLTNGNIFKLEHVIQSMQQVLANKTIVK